MPWREFTITKERETFIAAIEAASSSFSQTCVDFGISRKTGYKWLGRFESEGNAGLRDRSRRPANTPSHTAPDLEALIIALRQQHPCFGGRKLRAMLLRQGCAAVPASSTISDILRRHGLIDPAEAHKHKPFVRFEHEAPNDLWQMDFKGHFPMARGRCHPLTLLDDYSRYCLSLAACPDERGVVVKAKLTDIFRTNGLPRRMTMDNGSPWGHDQSHQVTALTVWLMRIGVQVSHSSPYHPQTQGKDERFHRTLKEELLNRCLIEDLEQAERKFAIWRAFYNYQRPHEGIGMMVPDERYRPSSISFPEKLPEIVYDEGAIVRKVQSKGEIYFRNRIFRISSALKGMPVELKPGGEVEIFDVYFCQQCVEQININHPDE